MPHRDPEARKLYAREYRKRNKEVINARNRSYSSKTEYNQKYYEQNKEVLQEYRKREQVKSRENERNRVLRDTSPELVMWRAARNRAQAKNLPFDIEVSDIVIPEFCPVLGIELYSSQGHFNAASPSLDKVVPDLGYVKGNIWVISHKANIMKHDATLEELLLFCHKMIEFFSDYGTEIVYE